MNLAKWLDEAEVRYRKFFSAVVPANLVAHPPCQIYAYEQTHDDSAFVVLCVGINYSQGNNKAEKRAAANLNQCFPKYRTIVNTFSDPLWMREWATHSWSSPRFPVLPSPEKCFFVMTNLCPFITVNAWGSLLASDRNSLLTASKRDGVYPHIEELIAALRVAGRQTVIIGYGLDVFSSIHEVLEDKEDWLYYANLSAKPWVPARWCAKMNTFVGKK